MKNIHLTKLILIFGSVSCCFAFQTAETARWEKEAKSVTIVRDDWGIAHISGKTDADAVFALTPAADQIVYAWSAIPGANAGIWTIPVP